MIFFDSCKITFIYVSIFLIIMINNIHTQAAEELFIYGNEITFDNNKDKISANGNALVKSDNLDITSDFISYDKSTDQIIAENDVKIIDAYNNVYFVDKIISNSDFSNAKANNIRIRLKDNSRIVGSSLNKKDNINIISDAEYTPCIESNYLIKDCPGWKLKSKNVYHDEASKTMHYDHSVLYVLNTPILYTPYFSHPDPSVKKRTGFLVPSFKSDNELGQTISLPYFYNISSNEDLTFTPTFQSAENNHLTAEYRLLSKKGSFNFEGNVNDNNDGLGTRHYFFANTELASPLNKFDISIQTANNDTYMKKNQINEIDVLVSGINIEDEFKGNYFSLETKSYKHLSTSGTNKWEYLYPKIEYNINDLNESLFNGNLKIKNQFLKLKNLDKEKQTNISAELKWNKEILNQQSGIIFKNYFDTRIMYSSIDSKNSTNEYEQIRIYPQLASIITYPLSKQTKNSSQILKPIIIPIIAPYNNYTGAIDVNNTNMFSLNRTSDLSLWESGPRINYGIEWFIDYKNLYDAQITLGQSAKINKSKDDTSEEISDFIISSVLNISEPGYLNAEFILDKDEMYIKKSNFVSSIGNKKFKTIIEYDYTSDKYSSASEQIGIGAKINLFDNIDFKFSGKKDLYNDNNIGYETGLFYENDCLAMNLKYYRDLTKFKDIKDSEGISFVITLKPFGSTKTYGKSKIFGPKI